MTAGCAEDELGSSAAMAGEPVPNVAKIKLAETVIATAPVTRVTRDWAWLRSAERRDRADM
jgi:hypothetical protein